MAKRKASTKSGAIPASDNKENVAVRSNIANPGPTPSVTAPSAEFHQTTANNVQHKGEAGPKQPRQAKVAALDNAVWMQVAPGPSRKRATPPSPKAVRMRTYKKRKSNPVEKNNKNQRLDNGTGVKEHVSIPPVPGAPKKAWAYTSLSTKSAGKRPDEDEPSVTGSEAESDSSFFVSDDEANDSADDTVRRDTTAAEKRFADEQPFWLDDERESKGKVPSTLIIRGEVIEISDDKVPVTSPTKPLAPMSVHHSIASEVDVVVKNELNNAAIAAALLPPPYSSPSPSLPPTQPTTPLEHEELALPAVSWPKYTDLLETSARPLSLLLQHIELRLIIRKAMELIEEHVRFEDAFPEFSLRTKWNRHVLIQACQVIGDMSFGTIKEKYTVFGKRMRVDTEYVGKISALLDPRISVLRGETKSIATSNARAFYGLEDGCMTRVQTLLAGNYIFPRTNGEHGYYQYNKPFEHPAIIATLRNDLFSSSYPITRQYSYRFLPGQEEKYMLEPSMVALAATAVYASVKEWETGIRTSIPFTMSVYDSVYRIHLNHLEAIQGKNEKAYKSMMRRLFRLSSSRGSDVAGSVPAFTLTDITNMNVDE